MDLSWGRLLDICRVRKRCYQQTFTTMAGQETFKDLATFCRARETCVVPGDTYMTGVLEGRREVFLRIQEHMMLTPEQLMTLYTGGNIKAGD